MINIQVAKQGVPITICKTRGAYYNADPVSPPSARAAFSLQSD